MKAATLVKQVLWAAAVCVVSVCDSQSHAASPVYQYQEITDGTLPFVVRGANNQGAYAGSSASGAGVWIAGRVTHYAACRSLAAINGIGRAVGETPDGHGYCWVDTKTGAMHTQRVSMDDKSLSIVGVDAKGRAVGSLTGGRTPSLGVLLNGHVVTPIVDPHQDNGKDGGTIITGVSTNGIIVGYYMGLGRYTGFVLQGDTYTDATYQGFNSFPQAVNHAGNVVGYYFVSNAQVSPGYLVTAGGSTSITFDRQDTKLVGIRANGEIVGVDNVHTLSPTSYVMHTNSKLQAISFPGAVATTIVGITNTGQIYGTFQTIYGGIDRSFIAIPIQKN